MPSSSPPPATFLPFLIIWPSRMSDSQRKEKDKATTGKRKRGKASVSIIDLMHDASLREKALSPQEKADQLLPATDPIKFANRYYQTKRLVLSGETSD
ncbi:hypothetical protein HN873_071168 [Arachis hypogaea]